MGEGHIPEHESLKVEHSPLGSTRSIRELESLRAVARAERELGFHPHHLMVP